MQLQENIALARWLSTRVDEKGRFQDSALTMGGYNQRIIRRRLATARRRGLDWVNPPEACTTERLLSRVLERPASIRGRRPTKKAQMSNESTLDAEAV